MQLPLWALLNQLPGNHFFVIYCANVYFSMLQQRIADETTPLSF